MSDFADHAEAVEAMDRELRIRAVQAALPIQATAAEKARDCSICLDDIDPARLKALPGVRICVDCATARERRRRGL